MWGRSQVRVLLIILCCAVPLGMVAASAHVRYLGRAFLQEGGEQWKRHRRIVEGVSDNPRQYRVLSEYLVSGVIEAMKALGVPNPVPVGFISFRVGQNILGLFLAGLYYRRLGLSLPAALVGMCIFTWGMMNSIYGSDLSFSTHMEVIFYLIAAIVIVSANAVWIIPLAALAAANRQTSGLMPLMLVSVGVWTWRERVETGRRLVRMGLAALATYGIVLGGLRVLYGSRVAPHYGIPPGLGLLWYNLSDPVVYLELTGALGIIPLIAIAAYRSWPWPLRLFGWVIVPIWFVFHVFGSAWVMILTAETRLFLVPQVLVFIPGSLFGIVAGTCVSDGRSGGRMNGETHLAVS